MIFGWYKSRNENVERRLQDGTLRGAAFAAEYLLTAESIFCLCIFINYGCIHITVHGKFIYIR